MDRSQKIAKGMTMIGGAHPAAVDPQRLDKSYRPVPPIHRVEVRARCVKERVVTGSSLSQMPVAR
jgi:hypothetical protein